MSSSAGIVDGVIPEGDPPPPPPTLKRQRLANDGDGEEQEQQQQQQQRQRLETRSAVTAIGFSLSALEELRNRSGEDGREASLDQQLRQFQVLDEVQGSETEEDSDGGSDSGEDDKHDATGNGGGDSSDYDQNFDDDDIENLLDDHLPDEMKEPKKPKYEERFKTVLEEKRHNHFEVLPEGWVQVTHNSGMPLFLHKQSRVCCASRPYFLGAGSVRKHAVPVGAIPCLNYRRALEEERLAEKEKARLAEASNSATTASQDTVTEAGNGVVVDDAPKCPYAGPQKDITSSPVVCLDNGVNATESAVTTTELVAEGENATTAQVNNTASTDIRKNIVPAAQILTIRDNMQKESLTPSQLNDYCTKLFNFKVIRVLRFRSWNARRRFTKNRKHIKNLQRPTLPEDTKLIKFPILSGNGGEPNANTRCRKEWIMNPNGKSFVCILHEYVQHALKKQPTYEFKELENAATPYSATVSINELKYGTGYGTSKKQAKADAARETLEILIPEMKDKIIGLKQEKNLVKNNHKDLSVFDDIKIEDPRVSEFCNKTTEPSPHAILLTCLQRNFGLGDVQIHYEINRTKNQKNEFTMTVGKHTAKVLCKNKREGKQLASQAILQILHPHIKTWGSLLRLYGNNSIKTFKEKKLEEQEITVLQSKAAINQPNYAILEKLRSEMLKLSEKNKSVHTMGTFVPTDLPTSSGSNLNNLEL